MKTVSQGRDPVATGTLVGARAISLTFVIAGGMRAFYDLGILAVFLNHKLQE